MSVESNSIMVVQELIPGLYYLRGRFAPEFGFISTYIIVDDDQALLVDPGTAGDPGDLIIKALKELGLKPKSDLKGIICTHGHPDHIGGVGRLQQSTDASVMIHKNDAELLETPDLFLKKRLRMDFAKRFAMKFDKSPLRVNFRPVTPDRILVDGDTIKVGRRILSVIYTGGHSEGHIVLYEKSNNLLFSGDEINNFPNDPRKFYVDLSGSLTNKIAATEQLRNMKIDYLLPAHDVFHIGADANLQIKEVQDGVVHFQDTVLALLKVRGEADVDQIVLDIDRSRSVPYPVLMDSLLPTTVEVALKSLRLAGLVATDDENIWFLP